MLAWLAVLSWLALRARLAQLSERLVGGRLDCHLAVVPDGGNEKHHKPMKKGNPQRSTTGPPAPEEQNAKEKECQMKKRRGAQHKRIEELAPPPPYPPRPPLPTAAFPSRTRCKKARKRPGSELVCLGALWRCFLPHFSPSRLAARPAALLAARLLAWSGSRPARFLPALPTAPCPCFPAQNSHPVPLFSQIV